MAQLNPTTLTVTPTVGEDWINLPINPENILRAYLDTVTIGTADLNLYPAIRMDLVTKAVQYWIYNIGDTATRDADLATVNSALNLLGGAMQDISASIRQDSSNWSGNGQLVFNSRFTLVWFTEQDFDACNMHDPTINTSGTALGTHSATTIQDTTQSWTVNEFAGQAIRMTSGASIDEVHRIVSNTSDTITIAGAGFVGGVANGDAYEVSKAAQITIPYSGKYTLPGSLTYSANSSGVRGIAIYTNNVFLDNWFALPVGTVESAINNQSFAYDLSAGDIIEFYAYQSTGFNLSLLSFGLRNRVQAIAQRGVIK